MRRSVACGISGFRCGRAPCVPDPDCSNTARSSALFAPTVKRLAPDVVDAHDLITLPGASRIAAAIGAKILYDVHDLYLHQPKRRSLLARWQGARLEGRYIRQADAVITVSNGMADHLRDAYDIPRPDVVLNSPVDSAPSDDVGRDLRSELRLAPDIPLGVYTGARSLSRNLDRLVRALAEVPGLHLALVGHPQTVDDNRLRALADAGGCADRVHILPPVPHEIVSAYISTADFGILPYNGECLNHDVTLPTKLFEAVFAGLPVAVSELPALTDFVGRTGTGLAMDSLDEASIATTLRRMAKDRQRMRLPPTKIETLRKTYGWPAQAKILLGIYDRLFGAEARTPRPVAPV